MEKKAKVLKSGKWVNITKRKCNPDATCEGDSVLFYDEDGTPYVERDLSFDEKIRELDEKKTEAV